MKLDPSLHFARIVACGIGLLTGLPVHAFCGISNSFKQPDVEVVNRVPTVFQRTVLFDENVFVFSEAMRVNTDGTLRSYSVTDPWGSRCDRRRNPDSIGKDPLPLGCAMNTICNGLYVVVPNPNGGMQKIKDDQCKRLIQEFNRIKAAPGWRPSDGSRIDPFGVEMKTTHEPCMDAGGKFMTSTASTRSGIGGGSCSQSKYLDALVPSIVVPRCWTAEYSAANPRICEQRLPQNVKPNLTPGDLVALAPRAGGDPIFAVIGDTGPHRKLGEASVGLLMKAAGASQPRTYLETQRLDGQAFHVVIFRNSKFAGSLTPTNVASMEAQASAKFVAWAGSSGASLDKLKSCGIEAMQ